MILAPVTLWTLRRTFRVPILIPWLVSSAGLWAVATRFGPLGITTRTVRDAGPVYEVAFLGALAGALLALITLSEAAWILERVAPARRLQARAVGLFVGGAAGASIAVLPGLWLATDLHLPSSNAVLAAGFSVAHLAALGLLLLRAPGPSAPRALALPVLAWLLPSALSGSDPLSAALRRLVDAAAPMRAPQSWSPLAAVITLAVLAGAAILLEIRPRAHAAQARV